ncbi:lactonase family protein [Pantoea sp. ACRSB]|uniref:lactonase family protein n=1 Tax=Pantoea sp. ACRSB TaxID=2918207 RepID=UPI002892FB37|nr:lactonase family protein [Pantoea sp. ACRSB]MCG7389865.1 lactonase family protein [Pantoea sp. ACRSB]
MNRNKKTMHSRLATNITMALSLAVFSLAGSAMANAVADNQTALVGTWTSIPDAPSEQKPEHPSEGLYRLKVNSDGTLTPLDVIKMKSPSWIVKSRDGRFAYTTNEESSGAVTALSVDKNGQVRVLNIVDSHGQQPTHATISPDGKFLFVSNYSVAKGGAGVSVFPIHHDGKLGEQVQHFPFERGSGAVEGRQDGGHAHSTTFTHDGKYLYAADLGGDKLHAYRYHADKAQPLEADSARDVSFTAGSGPRHMVFAPNGKHAYVINEMAGEIVVLTVNQDRLDPVAHIKLNTENNSAEYRSGSGIILSPNGKYVIAANRGSDNKLLVFKIEADGMLGKPVSYNANGIEPRAFSFDSSGKYLYVANVFTNNISLFHFNAKTGEMKAAGDAAKISTPTDIKFFN